MMEGNKKNVKEIFLNFLYIFLRNLAILTPSLAPGTPLMFIPFFLTRSLTRKPQIICRHIHRQVQQKMKVVVVPALGDNFSYLVVDQSSGKAFAVGML
jgi:hypothetical protein